VLSWGRGVYWWGRVIGLGVKNVALCLFFCMLCVFVCFSETVEILHSYNLCMDEYNNKVAGAV